MVVSSKRLWALVLFIVSFILLAVPASRAGVKGAEVAIKAARTSEVCMINDEVMKKPQIPVVVEGKTYYGCCPACAKTLTGDPSSRYSKDPQTGKEVDKAKAFITEGLGGAALYFESEETARKYYSSR